MCEKAKSRAQGTHTGLGPNLLSQSHCFPRPSVATPWPEGEGERARKERGSGGKYGEEVKGCR